MQPPGIYNHRHLAPASAPSNASLAAPSSGRLNDLLELVRAEFDNEGREGGVWKQQRDEYENKIQQQINELGMIRQSLYELESTHAKLRTEYEGEIQRLRRELEARGGPAEPPEARGDDRPGYIPAPFSGPPLNGESGRSPYPPPNAARPPSAAADRPDPSRRDRELRDVRDPRDMRLDDRRELMGPGPGPGPGPGAALGGRDLRDPRDARDARDGGRDVRDGRDGRERPVVSPPVQLSDLDPENVSRELKKEGSDWFAVWSSQNKKLLDVGLVHTLSHETVVCCVKFSNDGKYLATGCNRTAQIYDVKDGRKVCVLLDEATNRTGDLYIRSICFSPDGKYLATGAEDRQIRIWDIKSKRIRHLLQGHMQEIYSLDFSRDGRYLVSGSGDKSARIWDVEKGHCVFDLRIEDFIHNEHGPIDAGITSVALSPDGKLVAAGSLDTMVRVWNVTTGQQVERLKGHKDSVYSVAFSTDGKSLVSGSLDRTIRIWDLSATKRAVEAQTNAKEPVEKGLGTCQSTLNGHKDYVLSVAYSPDGQWVVSGSKDRSIQFWSVASGQAQFLLQGHKNSVISIDLARTGGYLASGSGDCQARIWRYESTA